MPPAAPNGLTATAASATQVNLAWTATAGATGYSVKRATSANGPYETIATGVTATSFADTGRTGGTAYHYLVTATNSAGGSLNSNGATATTPLPTLAPTYSGFRVNDGAAQRSHVTRLTLSFDQPVTVDAVGISLVRRGGGAQSFTLTPSADGKSIALTFSGSGIIGGSLADGVYDLVLRANAVRNGAGQSMSGGDRTLTFHRLFGDGDGNKTVDNADLFQFRRAQNSSIGSANYNATYDFNLDGQIDNSDLFQFRRRQNTGFVY